MEEPNPYAAPLANPAGEGSVTRATGSPRAIVGAWEKLRLMYNIILAVAGVIVVFIYIGVADMPLEAGLLGALFMAIGANVCFLVGPLSETYLAAIFDRPEMPTYRRFSFWVGVLGSVGFFALLTLPGVMFF